MGVELFDADGQADRHDEAGSRITQCYGGAEEGGEIV